MSSWTTKKSINIFEKKFIFIPINEHLHWSLCVVVNAGKIMNAHQPFENGEKKEAALILFLDSLKAHKKHKVCTTVRKWLQHEAEKLNIFQQDLPDGKPTSMFDKNFMPLLDPPSKNPYFPFTVVSFHLFLTAASFMHSSFLSTISR